MKLTKKNDEANKLLFEFKKIDEILDNAELVCTKADGTKYDFNRFSLPLKFIEKIYKYEITLDEAIEKQAELKELINKLNNDYNPRSTKKAKEKKRVLESAKNLMDARKDMREKKNQKKNQIKTNFLNILRMNQKVLTMICLKNILNL